MVVFKQLFKEFILPLIVAISWTAYNVIEANRTNIELRDVINIFGPSFFLASWLISQWFRVTKQQRVESGLKGIEADIKKQVDSLEEKSTELVNYITGGDSACYMCGPDVDHNNWSPLLVRHLGKHPLYNVKIRVVDIDIPQNTANETISMDDDSGREFRDLLGDLVPNHSLILKQHIPLGSGNSRRFNIFFSARNGSFKQILRLKRVNGVWRHALMVTRDNELIHEDISAEYPRTAIGNIDWEA